MKYCTSTLLNLDRRRAPQGARGLKWLVPKLQCAKLASRPARGAWIEIVAQVDADGPSHVAPRKGRVD